MQSLLPDVRRHAVSWIWAVHRLFVYGLAAISVFTPVAYAGSDVPRFEDYPVPIFTGTPKPLNLASHSQAGRFRTVLRDVAPISPGTM